MWCANCNRTSYSENCEVCGSKTQQDTPIELFWCDSCRVPIIVEASETSARCCPRCGKPIRYLAKDLRPVFPEERLLLEIIQGKPFAYEKSSVWASGSRYYIDGKASFLSIERLKGLDVQKISAELNKYSGQNTYGNFNQIVNLFVECNRERLAAIKQEAENFVREQVALFPKHKLVISFSGGKDSTVVADIVTRALSNPSIVQVFGDTTLEFPMTYEYVARHRKQNPLAILKTAKNKEQDFYKVCDEIGPPARMMRWCCTMFKTGPITRVLNSLFKDSSILTFYGIRKHESISRSKYDRVASGANVKIQKQTVAAPIFYWTDSEVWLYILGEGIDFNDAYRLGYDRVGCWCCPNNTIRSQFLAQIYMPEQSKEWREYLIGFAKRIGKPDPEVPFPQIAIDILNKYKIESTNVLLESQDVNVSPETGSVFFRIPDNVQLHDYQVRAIDAWIDSGGRGIFDMATGTGKTYTALGALARLSANLKNHLAVVIICPYQHLVEQWVEDICAFGVKPLICYSRYNWKKSQIIKEARL